MEGDKLVPAKVSIPAVAYEALAGLPAEAIVKVLSQINPDDGELDPQAGVEKMLAMPQERKEGPGI
jgi:hypothetical protein